MNKVVFLDRDGTMNADKNGYIKEIDSFNLFPFTTKAIAKFNQLDFKVVVVTNQSGIARGYFTFSDLNIIHEKMTHELARGNAFVNDILISPYHPKGVVEPYNIVHESRKPGTALLKEYYRLNNFKTSKSFIIGDKASDIQLGNNFNLKTILVLTGEGEKTFRDRNKYSYKANFIVKDLWEAAKLIENLNI